MQTFTIAINDNIALEMLRDLEEKHFISIVESDVIDSPAVPGGPLSLNEFKKWINHAEQTSTVSHEEAKSIWKGKRKQLQKSMR